MSVFLKELKINKATGIDNLSVRLIKGGSKVPDECKTVKLKQLYKKYKKTDPRNPLFPVISIILEKVIHYQTMHFVTKNYIWYKFQSGFRKFHFIDSCLLYLLDKEAKGFDSGLLTGMSLIDLQKAFDIIDHKILRYFNLERCTC